MTSKPLVVDLDGTLIRSDLTHELLILCARWKPHLLVFVLLQLVFNRAKGKDRLVELVGDYINIEHLPYEPAVIDLARSYKEAGQQVWLVSGSHQHLVDRVADHLKIFDRAKGTDDIVNLTSSRKADFLSETLADDYRYAGNSTQDYAVWRRCGGGYGFRAPAGAYSLKDSRGEQVVVEQKTKPPSLFRGVRKAMRLHQWAKNILIFVIPGLTLETLNVVNMTELVIAFILFGFMASGTYLLNDLFDIQDDRAHKTKRNRPLAAGDLSAPLAAFAMVALVATSLIGAYFLGVGFLIVLALYGVTTTAYSFRLKRLPILDVMILAALFTIRVWAGGVIIEAYPTAWLFAFIGLVFLSLAFAKRYIEVKRNALNGKVSGRGYRADDEPLLLAFGAASAYSSVLALVIYGLLADAPLIDSPYVFLSLGIVIAGWFMRLWMIAVRGELDDDPVLFAVKDRTSLMALVLAAVIVLSDKIVELSAQWF